MTDYCGGCGERLEELATGGRARCCSSRYWSDARPAFSDQYPYEKMCGFGMRTQTACVDRKGRIVQHAPLYLYGGFFLGKSA